MEIIEALDTARPIVFADEALFERRPIRCESTAGTPYTRHVLAGMPTIPENFLDLVAYLYRDEAHAREGKEFGGCGFFVGVPSADLTKWFIYFVSNYHVAVRDGFSCLRVNLQAGGVDIFTFDNSDWHFVPNGGDVAAVSVPLDTTKHRFRWLALEQFAAGTWLDQFGVGADVFMMGRFIDHDGGQTNKPAVRFGHVSILPTYLSGIPNSGPETEYYCLDMHSRSGFSGAPVSAYKTISNDLSVGSFHDLPMNYGVKLLAIHCGQFPETLALKGSTSESSGGSLVGYSGMTYALPCSAVSDLINCQAFTQEREAVNAAVKPKKNLPQPEAARIPDRTELFLKRMLNTPPQPKVTPARKPGKK